ncbi:MAG: hypothetical protein J4224_03790 [Candidatus Diapherotrites archaeon]|uniref:DNA-binding protein n=1 Tax=Candidatus Iainarchaeum sp. TaxID=3101447 RepID=A0A7J4IU15_9ARCH|nr:MAG: hypothetical protein QT03_C0001G1143 [archaeon GW2011_AR10]MBS3059515.1 hypothetical protein [Candidatus Diapherotrites archaeon]HIH09008.1 hypothetical protein [Candidatus Diapherotrites archaeon]
MSEENFEELSQLKENYFRKQKEEQKRLQAEMQLNSMVKSVLTEEARERLNNVRLVNKELYLNAVQAILYHARSGNIEGKLSEEQLKQVLAQLGSKKDFKIKRK